MKFKREKIGDLCLDQSNCDFLYPLVPLWTAESPLLPLGFRSSNTLHIQPIISHFIAVLVQQSLQNSQQYYVGRACSIFQIWYIPQQCQGYIYILGLLSSSQIFLNGRGLQAKNLGWISKIQIILTLELISVVNSHNIGFHRTQGSIGTQDLFLR